MADDQVNAGKTGEDRGNRCRRLALRRRSSVRSCRRALPASLLCYQFVILTAGSAGPVLFGHTGSGVGRMWDCLVRWTPARSVFEQGRRAATEGREDAKKIPGLIKLWAIWDTLRTSYWFVPTLMAAPAVLLWAAVYAADAFSSA